MNLKNMKRFGSIAMAGAMALSLAVPAFAATTQPENSTVITGAYKKIPISVTVPTTGTAQINPYGLPVALTKSNDSTVNLVNQQITHEVLAVRNNGDVDLDMTVTSFTVLPVGPNVSIAAAKDTDKAIKVELQVAGLDDAKYALSPENESLNDLLIDAFAADATWAGAQSAVAPAVSKGTTTIPTTGYTPADITTATTLGAATVADGEVTSYGNDSIALFRLKGELATDPKTAAADDPWLEADGFKATVVFKFVPAAPATYAVTVGTITGGTVTSDKATAAAGDTVTLTPTPTTAGQTPTYTIYKTGDNTTTITATGNTFTMPAYPVTVEATFS